MTPARLARLIEWAEVDPQTTEQARKAMFRARLRLIAAIQGGNRRRMADAALEARLLLDELGVDMGRADSIRRRVVDGVERDISNERRL